MTRILQRKKEKIIREALARVPASTSVAGPASQLDANGTTLDVDVINNGELLKRVGTSIVSVAPGVPGAHAATHQNGGADEIDVTGLSGVLADPQHPVIGALATEAVAGNDARLTNARTPTAHVLAGIAGLGAEHTVTGLTARQVLIASAANAALFRALVMADLPSEIIIDTELATELANYVDHATFDDHSARHENGGADEINVAGLNGVLADPQPPIIGSTGTTAVAGNDARLADARTPTAHAASHAAGGTDAVVLTEAQVTNLVADLAARALAGILAGSYAPGSVALANAQFLLHHQRLTLTGAQRLTLAGTSNALLLDLGGKSGRTVGSPKTLAGSFTVPHDNYYVQRKRLTLCGEARANLLGTADLILSDDFDCRNRITLSGRG